MRLSALPAKKSPVRRQKAPPIPSLSRPADASGAHRPWRVLASTLLILFLAACASSPPKKPPPRPRPPPVRPTPQPPPRPIPPPVAVAPLSSLPGWEEEDHAAALASLQAGCGVSRDAAMRSACAKARALGRVDRARAKAFLEAEFRAARPSDPGLLTAYFAPEYEAREAPGGEFTAPVRPRPSAGARTVAAAAPPLPAAPPPPPTLADADDAIGAILAADAIGAILDEAEGGSATPAPAPARLPSPSPSPSPSPPPASAPFVAQSLATAHRTAIETSPAPDALAWMRAEDLFFLQIQGSGTLVYPGGRRTKVIYAGDNGRPFVAIARPMVSAGMLQANQASGDGIRGWLAANRGSAADAVMRQNPRYIFFALVPDDGRDPAGAAGIPLPAGYSIAVDPGRHAYGDIFWIDASAPTLAGAFKTYRRMVMALDTGSAIRGEVRADLYVGRGNAAGAEAGRVRHTLRMTRIVPADGR